MNTRVCSTCQYYERYDGIAPCVDCYVFSHWTESDASVRKKAGCWDNLKELLEKNKAEGTAKRKEHAAETLILMQVVERDYSV